MKKEKRRDGEGTIRQKPDGRWEYRIMTGRRGDGHPVYKYLYGRTQRELRENVKAWKQEQAAGTMWDTNYFFGEWAEIWFKSNASIICRLRTLPLWALLWAERGTKCPTSALVRKMPIFWEKSRKKTRFLSKSGLFGGDKRDRTADLLNAIEPLSKK